MRRSISILLAALVLVIALCWGMVRLFSLRYARGDSYPPYSTLRADPVGAKALADALALVPGVEVRRNYLPLTRLKIDRGPALVHLNLRFDTGVDEAEFKALDQLTLNGVRAVFAFRSEYTRSNPVRMAVRTPAPATPAPATAPPGTPTPAPVRGRGFFSLRDGPTLYELAQNWEVDFDIAQDERRAVFHGEALAAPGAGDVEPSIPWHSALYFKGMGERWRTLYTCNNVPVIIERPYGSGSLVLCSDTFFLSNEGLRTAPRLLTSLLGLPRTVIFDEAGHGVTEDQNLATLARRMRLQGVGVVLCLMAVLFIWKNAAPLLPRTDHANEAAAVSGRDAGAGFINLLRRSVSSRRILETCVEAWIRAQGRRVRSEERACIESILGGREAHTLNDPVATYRTIAEGLTNKAYKTTPRA